MFDIHTFLNDLLSGIVFFIGYLVHHKTQIAKAVAQVAPLAEAVTAAADEAPGPDRDAHLKAAALLGIQALGYNALTLTYANKAAVADFMAQHVPDSLKASVTPETVETVLTAIQSELDAARKPAV